MRANGSDTVYLDYNATTPCDPRVVDEVVQVMRTVHGTPSSRSHSLGRQASQLLEQARGEVARQLGARASSEVVFTSGATEANNIVLLGVAAARAAASRHLVTQATEHSSVREPLKHLQRQGWEVTTVGVDRRGVIRLDQLEEAVRDDTALVSVMLANNETGTVQPVEAVAAVVRRAGSYLHCDAAQGFGKLPLDVGALDVDALTISGHKIYGPTGIGVLFTTRRRPSLRPHPLIHGGGQEGGVRPGTVNLAGAVGLAHAALLAGQGLGEEAQRLASLRDRFEASLRERLDGVKVNGCIEHRLPGTSNLYFDGVQSSALLTALDDVAVSAGSACTSTAHQGSHVLVAMGLGAKRASSSIRVSLGRFTTAADIEYAGARISDEVKRLRSQAGSR